MGGGGVYGELTYLGTTEYTYQMERGGGTVSLFSSFWQKSLQCIS